MADKAIGDYAPPVVPTGTDLILIQRGSAYQCVLLSALANFLAQNTGMVLSGHGAPAVSPGAGIPAAKYTNLDDSTEWYWDSGAGQWFKQG